MTPSRKWSNPAAFEDVCEALAEIVRFGELACAPVGGKNTRSKDVFQFPRHMLVEIEAALSRARGEDTSS